MASDLLHIKNMKIVEVNVKSMLEDPDQRAMQIWLIVLLQSILREKSKRLITNGQDSMKQLVPVVLKLSQTDFH